MSSAMNFSNFLGMVESFTPEQKAEVLALLQPAKKTKAAPAAPVLADGWAVADPAKKGPHAGKPRWYNAENEDYVYEFPSAAPAPAAKKAAKKASAPAPAPAPAASASDERLMGRMTKEEVGALSKEEKKRRNQLKKEASEARKAERSPEEQAKIDARVAAMKAGRAAKKASAGGSPSAEDDAAEEEE